MLSASFFILLPWPYHEPTTITCDHFPQFSFSCDKTILLEISARDRSCFLWSVNFLVFLLAAWSKVVRKALLNLMKEQVSRLAIVQQGVETEKYHIASFVVSSDESLASKRRL